MASAAPGATDVYWFDASVSVIDTRTGLVLHTIAVGKAPHGLTLFPQPGHYSIGHNGVYR